jgi:hypothetical protein
VILFICLSGFTSNGKKSLTEIVAVIIIISSWFSWLILSAFILELLIFLTGAVILDSTGTKANLFSLNVPITLLIGEDGSIISLSDTESIISSAVVVYNESL